ncbi:3988_t:CDS:2, partial [Gigaspora margarita]
PQDLYQTFCNAYTYYKQASHCNPTPNRQKLFQKCNLTWKQIKQKHKILIKEKIREYFNTIPSYIPNNSNSISSFLLFKINTQPQHNVEVIKNAVSQRDTIEKIEIANKKISEYERMYQISTDGLFKKMLDSNILKEKLLINKQETQLKKLKHHAKVQARLEAKKTRLLQEAAHAKKRKVTIKPRHSCTSAACHYHHPAKVALTSIARTDMKLHVDEHYCLASVKAIWIFAEVFTNDTVIVSQDNKAKIGLGIPAVGHTFKSKQTINEPVSVADHNFFTGSKMKLIPSVYLVIDSANSNDNLRLGQLAIFIKPEYFIGTLSTYIADLQSLVTNKQFAIAIMKRDKVKPIWVLLIDRGPDKNPKHMKNIVQYCNFFYIFNFDNLTIRTHAPDQSAFNSIEKSMSFLSKKLAGITLPVDSLDHT